MNYVIRSFIISLLMINTLVHSQEPERDIHMKMIGNSVISNMEEHHSHDWKKIETLASKFWKDPSSAVDQKVRKLEGKFYRFLLNTFLGDIPSVKKILRHYFEYQLDSLIADFQRAPVSRYQFWSKIPSHCHAVLAFELLAIERGIKLDENYHQLFSLASERARLIEEESQKIAEAAATPPPPPPAPPPPVKSIIPDAPQSPSLKLKHPTRDRAQKPKRSATPTLADLSDIRSGLKKTTTRTGSSSLSENVLEEIRKGGFNLRPASDRILKELPQGAEDVTLESILRKRFETVRPMISGTE